MATVTGGEGKAAAYEKRWKQLWAKYERLDSHPEWAGFIGWLLSRRPALRPATWRQYRAAVNYILVRQQVPEREYLQARLMEKISLPNRETLPPRTSSAKSKSLSTGDMNALIQHLESSGGRWDKLAGQWLALGSITGLRPAEWRHVEVYPNDECIILRVMNAKFDTQRAHGPYRTIYVSVTPAIQSALEEFIATVQSGDFAEVYEGCRMALWRAGKSLWPRRKTRITLYSARHQFAADAKSAGLAPEVIAALMGHAVPETCQTHYGKRRSGRGWVMVDADAIEVRRVVERTQQRNTQDAGKKPDESEMILAQSD